MVEKGSGDRLLLRAQGGDRRAFDELAAVCRPRLEALVRLRIGPELRAKTEVDDIVQETLLRAYRSLPTLRTVERETFFCWLAGIANHVVLDQARHHGRRPTVPPGADPESGDPSPSREARRTERFERLQAALDSLSSEHREVIILARIEGLKLSEIATRMNRSEGAAAQILWRALKKLRERFGDTESLHLPAQRLENRGAGHDD